MEEGSGMKHRLLERFAELFPYLVLSAYIAGCIFCILIDRMSYLINGSILAIPAIIGSFAFLAIKREDLDLAARPALFSHNPSVYPKLFLILYALTIPVLLLAPVDSGWGLLTVPILYAIILIQILSARPKPAVVLSEVVLTLVVTIYSYTLRPALYFGTTDILPHGYMATVTYLSGHVIPGELGTYTYFPLYHVFVAVSSHLLGLEVQTTLFVTTGLVFSSTVLFLYLLVNYLFKNNQIALLAVLLYAVNADVIYYGTYMVTRTMAYVGFLILLYLLYSMGDAKAGTGNAVTRPVARRVLVVIVVVFILLTHQITMPMIIILLGIIFVLERIAGERRYVTPAFLAATVSLLAWYWFFVAYPFVDDLFPRADPALYQSIVFTEVVYEGWTFLLNQVDTLFVVLFSLIGAIYLIWKQQPKYSIVFGVTGLAAIVLNTPGILTVIFQTVSILRIDRFAILFLPILAVATGVGIYVLARYLIAMKISPERVAAILIVLIALYGIGSLGLLGEEAGYIRYSFNQDEVTGFEHVLETVPSGSPLHSDYYTLRFFERKKIRDSERLGLPYYTTYLLQADLEVPGDGGYVVLPSTQLQHGGLLLEGAAAINATELDLEENLQPYPPTEQNLRNVTGRLSVTDRVYSNNGIEVYRLPYQ